MRSIGGLLRLLAANHIVHETGEDRYAPTGFSLAMGDKSTLVAPGLRIRCGVHGHTGSLNLDSSLN